MASTKGNAVIGQSGGPTSVINQSLVGVIQEIKKNNLVDQLLGARHGVKGIVGEDFISLKEAPDELLERIAATPAAAMGSTRDKPDAAYCEKIFKSFAKHDVRYFFYIGGNDSADTARIVGELATRAGHDLKVFHIPKTIDNDLRVHDHTPGFGSAAKFVAAAIMGDNYDNRSLPGIKVDVIMGRHAGFLTAASVLARQHDNDGPHLIYVPEAPLTEEKFLADVDAMYTKHGRCLIAVSEGIGKPDGKTWAEHMSQQSREGFARQYPILRHRRAGRFPGGAHHEETASTWREKAARASGYVWISSAQLPGLCQRIGCKGSAIGRPGRRAIGGRRATRRQQHRHAACRRE